MKGRPVGTGLSGLLPGRGTLHTLRRVDTVGAGHTGLLPQGGWVLREVNIRGPILQPEWEKQVDASFCTESKGCCLTYHGSFSDKKVQGKRQRERQPGLQLNLIDSKRCS